MVQQPFCGGMQACPDDRPGLHAVIVPLFRQQHCEGLNDYLAALVAAGLSVVLVDNNPETDTQAQSPVVGCQLLLNFNTGGIAGGLNRGIDLALRNGAAWITLLDQDSRIDPPQIRRLRAPLVAFPRESMVIGPSIWDQQKQRRHGRWQPAAHGLDATRLLISSGITFRSSDWPNLGCFHEDLCIDFVDHAWCFRAQARGFALFQHPDVLLEQHFGAIHPNRLCRWLGMRLYSPQRHFYGLRNLRWLCLQRCVPLDLKLKEVCKMSLKPLLWLLCEPQKRANLRAISQALTARLPGAYG